MNSQEFFFNLNPVNFFIVSGLVQNFILAGILFFRKSDNLLANRLLSLTIFIVNLHLTYLVILDTNLDNIFPFLLWIPYSYLTAVGPLILLYSKALTNTNLGVLETDKKHFIPIAIEIGLQGIMIFQAVERNQLFYNTPLYFYIMPLLYAWSGGSIFYYLKLSLDVIHKHENWVLKNFSNMKEMTLLWLQKLLRYYRLLWIAWIPFVTAFLLFFRFQLLYFAFIVLLYLLMIILTYLTLWIGIEGIGRGSLVFVKSDEGQSENKNFTKLNQHEIQAYIEKMYQLMKEGKIYLNENLSLRELASHMKSDPNLISFILNKHLNSNFYDFINRYRIEEVKTKLNSPLYKHLSLLGIALESGFNSKTTFNRVFKQITGITPTEFLKTSSKKH